MFHVQSPNFDFPNLYQLLSQHASVENDRVALTVQITCDFKENNVETDIKDILAKMISVDIDEITLCISNYADLDIGNVCVRIAGIMQGLSQITVKMLYITGIPFVNLDLVTSVQTPLSGYTSLRSVEISFAYL